VRIEHFSIVDDHPDTRPWSDGDHGWRCILRHRPRLRRPNGVPHRTRGSMHTQMHRRRSASPGYLFRFSVNGLRRMRTKSINEIQYRHSWFQRDPISKSPFFCLTRTVQVSNGPKIWIWTEKVLYTN
jgi:hypothetical protein